MFQIVCLKQPSETSKIIFMIMHIYPSLKLYIIYASIQFSSWVMIFQTWNLQLVLQESYQSYQSYQSYENDENWQILYQHVYYEFVVYTNIIIFLSY